MQLVCKILMICCNFNLHQPYITTIILCSYINVMRRRRFAIITMQSHRKNVGCTVTLTSERDIFRSDLIHLTICFLLFCFVDPSMLCKSVQVIWPKNVHFSTVSALSPVCCFTLLLKIWLPILRIFVCFSTVKCCFGIFSIVFFFNVFGW